MPCTAQGIYCTFKTLILQQQQIPLLRNSWILKALEEVHLIFLFFSIILQTNISTTKSFLSATFMFCKRLDKSSPLHDLLFVKALCGLPKRNWKKTCESLWEFRVVKFYIFWLSLDFTFTFLVSLDFSPAVVALLVLSQLENLLYTHLHG